MGIGYRAREAGYSLVELLVALSLLGLVLSLAWGIYVYGITSYSRGNDRAILQREERFLAEFFSRELMYASEVTIFPSLDEVPELGDNQAVLYSNDQGIWKKKKDGATLVVPSEEVNVRLSFRTDTLDDAILFFVDYTVGLASNPAVADTIAKSIHLFNTVLHENGTGTVVKYTKS